jgi:hypothetical protein
MAGMLAKSWRPDCMLEGDRCIVCGSAFDNRRVHAATIGGHAVATPANCVYRTNLPPQPPSPQAAAPGGDPTLPPGKPFNDGE